MKKTTKPTIFWLILGILVGVAICYTVMSFSTREMAPADFRHQDDGVLIASASNVLHVTSFDGFLYEPTEKFPVSKRFSIQMKHNDPGMLMTDFPTENEKGSISI